MAMKSLVSLLVLATAEADAIQQRATTTQPNWFKTSPDNYAGQFTKQMQQQDKDELG
jgi:hypothetical protein